MTVEVSTTESGAINAITALQEIQAERSIQAPEGGSVIAAGELTDEFRLVQGHIRQSLRHQTDPQIAEEATQEALVKIWEKQHQFTGGTILGWSSTVARNAAIDIHKRKRTVTVAPDDLAFTTTPATDNPEREALEADTLTRINMLLETASVSPTFRNALRLYALGYGQTEIAQILGIKRGTAGTKLHRGFEQLRKYFMAQDIDSYHEAINPEKTALPVSVLDSQPYTK